jgi:hypothetical protein
MSAQRIELVASTTVTSSGNTSPGTAVPTLTMALVGVDITAENMSVFDCWLEGSEDDGTTWYPLAPDSITVASTRVVTVNPTANEIVVAAAAVGKFSGEFKHLAPDKVRLAWALTGTDITFSASLVGK